MLGLTRASNQRLRNRLRPFRLSDDESRERKTSSNMKVRLYLEEDCRADDGCCILTLLPGANIKIPNPINAIISIIMSRLSIFLLVKYL